MRFLITLKHSLGDKGIIPINYSYPFSAAIYRILAKGDREYAGFLHEKGYGKGFKLFSFSQIQVPFKIEGDRLRLMGNEACFQIAFHLPQAMENFIKGLFQSEEIIIADQQSRTAFSVQSVASLPDPLAAYKENEILLLSLQPLSPVVAGRWKEEGKYDFLSPEDPGFAEILIYNWRSKIAACYDEATAAAALLMIEIQPLQKPFKSRLITIKAGTPQETKIRGWMNFELKVTGERRFVELLLNAGAGVYNAMGCGCVGVEERYSKII